MLLVGVNVIPNFRQLTLTRAQGVIAQMSKNDPLNKEFLTSIFTFYPGLLKSISAFEQPGSE